MAGGLADDGRWLEQRELLGHLLGDAQVLLWLFRVRDALAGLLQAQGLEPRALLPSERVQQAFAVRSWHWQLESPQAARLVVGLSVAASNEGFVECKLTLARPEALSCPWEALEAHQVNAVPLACARVAPDWLSAGYGAIRLRVALDKATVHAASHALDGSVLGRPVKPWLAPAVAQLLGVLEP